VDGSAATKKEKHFLVVKIADESTPLMTDDFIILEAVMTKRQYRLDWHTFLLMRLNGNTVGANFVTGADDEPLTR
jgi:hypothetical protein